MKVLIVEDDAESRLVLQHAVESLDHSVLVVDNGLDAWSVYQHEPVDVIISEWKVAGLDGLDLCRRVRSTRVGDLERYPYFIFLTALDDQEHLLDAMRAGADDYLGKPPNLALLEAQLNAAHRFTSLYSEVTAQKLELQRLNLQLHEQARLDPLTKLGNRLRLNEDLDTLQGRADRYEHAYGVLIADIDHFKLYNDTYGHLAGDDALRRVAGALDITRRQGDAVYRYGGEEFLLILPEQPLDRAVTAAERFRTAVSDLGIPHQASQWSEVLTISVGVSELPPAINQNVETTLRLADEALYEAKRTGRNRVIGRRIGTRLALANDG